MHLRPAFREVWKLKGSVDDFTNDQTYLGRPRNPDVSVAARPAWLVVCCVVDGRPLTALKIGSKPAGVENYLITSHSFD